MSDAEDALRNELDRFGEEKGEEQTTEGLKQAIEAVNEENQQINEKLAETAEKGGTQ